MHSFLTDISDIALFVDKSAWGGGQAGRGRPALCMRDKETDPTGFYTVLNFYGMIALSIFVHGPFSPRVFTQRRAK
jgi:hypothetical protein